MEFIGHYVSENSNRPAQSKHSLLKTWPEFEISRDVAPFLGFLNFYSTYIPHFEFRVACLRSLASMDMDTNIVGLITLMSRELRALA